MVEHRLAKARVASSNLVSRLEESVLRTIKTDFFFYLSFINKVKQVVGKAALIQSIGSPELLAEVDRQEEHKMLVVGFACVSNEKSHAERMLQHILDFMEKSTEAELISAEYEVY